MKLSWSDRSSSDTSNSAASTNWFGTSRNATSEPRLNGLQRVRRAAGSRSAVARCTICWVTTFISARSNTRMRSCRASKDDPSLTILWHKPPSKRSRQILLPHNASRSDFRPEQFERRARLVSAIARGRRWLDDVVSGRVTTVAQLCTREKCSVRQVNMAISFAFLAPNLIKAAIEGRLPRGIGIERLRDPPTEWSRQFEALGLNPE